MDRFKEAGYTIKAACRALGISRSSYYWLKNRDNGAKRRSKGEDELLGVIKSIKTSHPFWGYRRITAWLRHREGIKVNLKRVYRLMKGEGLLEKQRIYKARRKSQRTKPRASYPGEYWGIDMTKFMVSNVGWVYLIVILDWYTKKIVGWNISLRGRSLEWKEAIDMGINREFPEGVRGRGLSVISDNGCQPTSVSFMKHMKELGIKQIFTSYSNPKGNAETERVIRTIKEEVVWVNEFESFDRAKEEIGKWIEEDYNKKYVHSSLGYLSPEEFERKYYKDIEFEKAA